MSLTLFYSYSRVKFKPDAETWHNTDKFVVEAAQMSNKISKVLVTGATGFLGYRLLQSLQAQGYQVSATGRNAQMTEKISRLGIPVQRGDIQDQALLQRLCQGQDAVVHCAGLASPWGPYQRFYEINVGGTEAVTQACLDQGVSRLIQISSPSVYVSSSGESDVKESDPLPERFINAYAETKYLADLNVEAAHLHGLESVTLRPRAMIGREDTVIIPRLLRAQQAGRLRVIGDGQNRVDFTSVSNMCDAVDLALQATGPALNQVYNISNGEPSLLWQTLDWAFERLNLKLNTRRLPYAVAYSAAAAMELAARFQPGQPEPPLTRYSVLMIAKDHTLNIDKARQLLGYEPRQSTEAAILEFIDWWKQSQWLS